VIQFTLFLSCSLHKSFPFSPENLTPFLEIQFKIKGNIVFLFFLESQKRRQEIAMKRILGIGTILLIFVWGAGCAVPVREAVKLDMTAPVGTIEGNQFTGIRYPFRVTAPPGWKISTEFPKFMIDLGYEKEGLEESEVFLFNPETRSNLQIDFTAAGRYETIDQKDRERWVTAMAGSMKDELREAYGKDLKVEFGPTEPLSLKGVPVAAKKYATYTYEGVKRQQGWIYAFAEPYYIFILYMIFEKDGRNDYEALPAILNSFEYFPSKTR
jgi:hypothetical protein